MTPGVWPCSGAGRTCPLHFSAHRRRSKWLSKAAESGQRPLTLKQPVNFTGAPSLCLPWQHSLGQSTVPVTAPDICPCLLFVGELHSFSGLRSTLNWCAVFLEPSATSETLTAIAIDKAQSKFIHRCYPQVTQIKEAHQKAIQQAEFYKQDVRCTEKYQQKVCTAHHSCEDTEKRNTGGFLRSFPERRTREADRAVRSCTR